MDKYLRIAYHKWMEDKALNFGDKEELKLFNQYLAKLYMACQEDRKYNELDCEDKLIEVYYDKTTDKLNTLELSCSNTFPKDYMFITEQVVNNFIRENKELIKKVLGD